MFPYIERMLIYDKAISMMGEKLSQRQTKTLQNDTTMKSKQNKKSPEKVQIGEVVYKEFNFHKQSNFPVKNHCYFVVEVCVS